MSMVILELETGLQMNTLIDNIKSCYFIDMHIMEDKDINKHFLYCGH